MSHVTNESCHKWVMSQMSHVTNESCHTYEWVMSHTWMRHDIYTAARCVHAAAATSIRHCAAVACRRASRQWTGAELAPFRVCLSASAVVYAVTGRYSQKSALQPFYIVHSVVSLLLRISTYTPLCEPTRSRVNISKVSSLPYFVCMTWLHYQIYYMSTRTVPYLSLRERGRLCGHR